MDTVALGSVEEVSDHQTKSPDLPALAAIFYSGVVVGSPWLAMIPVSHPLGSTAVPTPGRMPLRL